jgi:hypothetical protein
LLLLISELIIHVVYIETSIEQYFKLGCCVNQITRSFSICTYRQYTFAHGQGRETFSPGNGWKILAGGVQEELTFAHDRERAVISVTPRLFFLFHRPTDISFSSLSLQGLGVRGAKEIQTPILPLIFYIVQLYLIALEGKA